LIFKDFSNQPINIVLQPIRMILFDRDKIFDQTSDAINHDFVFLNSRKFYLNSCFIFYLFFWFVNLFGCWYTKNYNDSLCNKRTACCGWWNIRTQDNFMHTRKMGSAGILLQYTAWLSDEH